jgi:hypothetical protein
MGKRELVLIALFAAIGIVVYQFTAPPPPPGSEEVSVGGIFNRLKRQIHGAQESVSADSKETLAIDGEIRLVRINLPRQNDLTIIGTDREDILVEMHVVARGYTQAEAKGAADMAKIKLERVSDAVAITAAWPMRTSQNPGFINQGTFTVSLPKRLQVRIEPHSGALELRDVAGGEIMGSRGATRISNVTGHLALVHTGGKLELENLASLKFTGRNSVGSIRKVSGVTSLDLTNGELKFDDVTGPVDVEARNVEFSFDAAKMAKGPFRFNANNGTARIDNLRTEARIDGRNTDINIGLAAAAPITVYSTGEDIIVTAPPGGYTIDAVATEGQLVLDDGPLKIEGEDKQREQRASGAVRGGGASLTLRATRGDIRLRKPESK